MKKIISVIAMLILSASGFVIHAAEQPFHIDGFTEIEFALPGTLYLTQSDQYRVVLTANREQIADIVIEKNGNVLEIRESWSLFGSDPQSMNNIEIRVSLPTLDALRVSSSGSVLGQNRFNNTARIQLITASSGDINMMVQADRIVASCSSSGSITLSGSVSTLDLETGSSGNIHFEGVIRDLLTAKTASMGKISLFLDPHNIVPESRLRISSMGDIMMKGRGYRVEALSSSAGSFQLKDFQCNDMKIDLSSSGNANINVTGNLDMHMSSSGRIINHGTPLLK